MRESTRFVLSLSLLWVALLAVSVLRFDTPEFRPWERLYDFENQRFLPNQQITMQAIGDLGYKTWNRRLQARRMNRFTTDRFGYRNPTNIENPEVVVIGDSFVAGAGLSDEETVTAHLAEALGLPVYNFAGENLNAPARFFKEVRFAKQRPRLVVWAPVARGIEARPLLFREPEAPTPMRIPLSARWRALGDELRDFTDALNRDNGLVREARFGLEAIAEHLRETPYLRRLAGGDEVLALSLREQGLLLSAEARKVDHCIEMVVAFSKILESRGVDFIFSPIPESGTIYPELFDPEERARIPASSFLERLIAGVRDRGVRVVDLRPVFAASREPYLYLPDDTHWNGRATRLAAEAWSEAVRERPLASAQPR